MVIQKMGLHDGKNTDHTKRNSVYVGNIWDQGFGQLKSSKERAQRADKANKQIAFWEQRLESLKETNAETIDDIRRKLEAFHNYTDELAAVKKSFNYEEMFHVMDEAKEIGENIAEGAKEVEAKTPEEMKEEAKEEALEAITGQEQSEGVLTELLDELDKVVGEMSEADKEALEEAAKNMKVISEESLQKLEEQALTEKRFDMYV